MKLSEDQYVSDLATDDDGVVLAVKSCTNRMTAEIIRLTNGRASVIKLPPRFETFGQLVDLDGQIWVVVTRPDRGAGEGLLATDGSSNTRQLPRGTQSLNSASAVSPDGRRAVRVVADPGDEPGFHVKVTDTATGNVAMVPGIRLGGSSASVAFSPDSRWLVVAVSTLAGGRILLYGPDDLQGPYSISGTLPGPQVGGIPIFITGSP